MKNALLLTLHVTYRNAKPLKEGTGVFKESTGEVLNMLITNTDTIPGKEIVEILGLTEMLTEAREESLSRMAKDAEALGADAVVNVRFMTSQITQGAAELLVYGTAVKIK
jgi:uncharacterized protein YbjQ (UPF0145 family)